MTRMLSVCLAAACLAAVHLAGCAASAPAEDLDPELSAAEVAALPDTSDVDHVGLDAVLAAEPPESDAATFDNDDADTLTDIAVDDTDEAPAPSGIQASAAILKFGLHPRASDALRSIGITASRIMQTIGNAAASAGTHAQDGVVDGHPYSAATDISVKGLTESQVRTLVARLDSLGFAAFYRNPGHDGWPSSEIRHMHVVFAGARMKSSLRAQISDFLAGRNGLASHSWY